MKSLIITLVCVLSISACKTSEHSAVTSIMNNGLIKDCPEELISNQMPLIGKTNSNKVNQYYIYKGERKEIKDFDSVWVSKNCKVKLTIVQ
jgi:hypothetical protein